MSRSLPPSAKSSSANPRRAEVVHVVGQAEVDREVRAARGAGLGRIASRVRPRARAPAACPGPSDSRASRGVLGRHVVRMGAVGALGREATSSGRARRSRVRGAVDGGGPSTCAASIPSRYSRIVGDRLVVRVAAHSFDHRRVAHAEAEHEPTGKRLGQRLVALLPSPSHHGRRSLAMPVAAASVFVAPSSSAD